MKTYILLLLKVINHRRFPEQYKDKEQLNVLTFLDPRQRLLYADTQELQDRILDVLCDNSVYDKVLYYTVLYCTVLLHCFTSL